MCDRPRMGIQDTWTGMDEALRFAVCWLHADPQALPACRLVPAGSLAQL